MGKSEMEKGVVLYLDVNKSEENTVSAGKNR